MRRLIAYGVGVIGTYEWVHLLGPVLRDFISGKRIHEVLIDLVMPGSNLNIDFGAGYFFILLTFGVIPFIVFVIQSMINYCAHSFVPISVLETHLTLEFSDDLSWSRLTRKQLYHANRPGQNAYIARSGINSPSGQLLRSSIDYKSTLNGKTITKSCELFGGSDKSVEIVELFSTELPHSWLVSILPDNFVRFLYNSELGCFRKIVAKRTAVAEQLHEYDGDEGRFSLTSLRYPVTNVRVVLRFPEDVCPEIPDLRILLVKDNSGHQLDPEQVKDGGSRVCEINLTCFYQSTLHVIWKNTKLSAVRGQNALMLPVVQPAIGHLPTPQQ